MTDNSNPLDRIYELLAQEIISYEALLNGLQQEWEYLRRRDIPSMVSLLQIKEGTIAQIKAVQQSLDQVLTETIDPGNRSGPPVSLLQLTQQWSPPQARKLQYYQHTLSTLKRKIQQANERNRCFIQDTLHYLRDLLSMFTCPVQEEPVYAKEGKRGLVTPLSSWISREV